MTEAQVVDENPAIQRIDTEIEAAVGFALELAGKERIHWADTPREASEKIVRLWDLARELKQSLDAKIPVKYLCKHCNQPIGENYRVHDEVWAQTGLKKYDGVLHLRCLERLIGRPLSLRDFTHHRVNAAVKFGFELRERELLRTGGTS